MQGLEESSDRDTDIVLKECQENNQPYCYWDKDEVEGFPLNLLPEINGHPDGWDTYEKHFSFDPADPDQVDTTKNYIQHLIGISHSDVEIGFGVVVKEDNFVVVRAYTQPVAKSPAFVEHQKAS